MEPLVPRTKAELEQALRKNILRTIAAHHVGHPLPKLSAVQMREQFGKFGDFKHLKFGLVEEGAEPFTEWEMRAILYGDTAKDDDHYRNVIHREFKECLAELGSAIRGDKILEMATFAATDLVPLVMQGFVKKLTAINDLPDAKGGQILVQMSQEIRAWMEAGGVDVKRDDAAELKEHLSSLRGAPVQINHYHNSPPPPAVEVEREGGD